MQVSPAASTHLFAHDVRGLHDVARGQPMAPGQRDRLLQGDAQGAAATGETGQLSAVSLK